MSDENQENDMPPPKRAKICKNQDSSQESTCNANSSMKTGDTRQQEPKIDFSQDKYNNFVTPEELEKFREFKILDEVKSNDEDSNDDDSDSSDGKSEGLAEEEIEKMLEEDLPEGFKGAPKPKEKPYVTRQKTVLEEKGVNYWEVLPLDWMMVRHYSGMPVYMHRTSRVCTLSKPYFLGKGNTRRHDIPISAIPCLAYRRALEEEKKQQEIDKKIEEQIRTGTWVNNLKPTEKKGIDSANKQKENEVVSDKENIELKVTEESGVNDVLMAHAELENNLDENNGLINEKSKSSKQKDLPSKCPFKHLLQSKTKEKSTEDNKENNSKDTELILTKDTEENGTKDTEGNTKDTDDNGTKDSERNKTKDTQDNDTKDSKVETKEVEEIIKHTKETDATDKEESTTKDNEECTSKDKEVSTTKDTEENDENAKEDSTTKDTEENNKKETELITCPVSGKCLNLPKGTTITEHQNSEDNNKDTNPTSTEEIPLNRQPVVLPGGIVMPPPKVETVNTSWKTQHLTPEQVNDYCKHLFKFKTVHIMHFNRWADRRKYTKARKTLQYPTLPEDTKLITIPAQPALGGENGGKSNKRDWVMNMNGRSYLSVFHEYVRRALQKQPVYEFVQLENASTPYQATVYIGGMAYGVGHGSSKRQAKAAAARASIHILIPEMKDELDPDKANRPHSEPDFSFFDYVGIEDPRITEFCAATCEPSPHAILRTCLLRNFGAGDRHIHTEMKKLEFQKIELTMKVGKHTATVVCKNKKTAKQRASQAILQALHPHVRSWGSLLRLYGSRSVKSCKEKKLEEQQITLLQDKARHNEPNYAVLEKLRSEMKKLKERDAAVVGIGTLLLPSALPDHSGAGLNNVDL